MDLKQFAKPFQWQGATLWFLPYRGLPVDMAIRALNELEPEAEWVHAITGKRYVGDEPAEVTRARDKAEKMNIPFKTDWQRRRLWTLLHDTFYLCLPSIVAVDFPDFDDSTGLELRVFAAYWNDPGKTFEERWTNFKAVIGTATTNALWEGYVQTRENPAPAKPELGQDEPDDPKDAATGDVSAVDTSSS